MRSIRKTRWKTPPGAITANPYPPPVLRQFPYLQFINWLIEHRPVQLQRLADNAHRARLITGLALWGLTPYSHALDDYSTARGIQLRRTI